MKKCPYCNSEINEDVWQCDFCGEDLTVQCPYCKENIHAYDKRCPHCDAKLQKDNLAILTYITYAFVFFQAILPCWLYSSFINHPHFWKYIFEKPKDKYDIISDIISLTVVSCIPAIIGIVKNYRRKIFVISIISIIILSLCSVIVIAGYK